MTESLSKAALTNASGLVSHPADVETGLGMNSPFCSPCSQRALPWDLPFPLHWRAQGWKPTSDAKHCATLLLAIVCRHSSQLLQQRSGD